MSTIRNIFACLVHESQEWVIGLVRKLHAERKAGVAKPAGQNTDVRLFLTTPIFQRMRSIEGWLEEAEADLLIAAVTRAAAAVPDAPAVVEVGSYCGKSTVVLGSALNAFDDATEVKIYAIDPHDGIVGALDQGVEQMSPSLETFRQNISNAGLDHLVEPIVKHSFEVEWDKPICFLFIDGLHDYANVARDFYHFESSIAPGGFVAFHDYASCYPGVQLFVDELLVQGRYEKVHQALAMIVVRKKTESEFSLPVRHQSLPTPKSRLSGSGK
jgi:predicted O-methyltransferase YrrM